MNTTIEAVFLDIDGTLYYNGRLVPSAVKAVRELLKKDLIVTICTGRSVIHTRKIKQELGIENGIYFNGGLVHYQTKQIYAAPLRNETVTSVSNLLSCNHIPAILHTEYDLVAFSSIPDELHPILNRFDFPSIKIVDETVWAQNTHPVFQLNAFVGRSLEPLIESKFPECLLYRWDEQAVDLQRKGSDKSIGALVLLEHLGISPRNAVHIGDGGNDIGMFNTLGYSVAMGNAANDVKQHAKMVTNSANDNGVFIALKTLGLIQ